MDGGALEGLGDTSNDLFDLLASFFVKRHYGREDSLRGMPRGANNKSLEIPEEDFLLNCTNGSLGRATKAVIHSNVSAFPFQNNRKLANDSFRADNYFTTQFPSHAKWRREAWLHSK